MPDSAALPVNSLVPTADIVIVPNATTADEPAAVALPIGGGPFHIRNSPVHPIPTRPTGTFNIIRSPVYQLDPDVRAHLAAMRLLTPLMSRVRRRLTFCPKPHTMPADCPAAADELEYLFAMTGPVLHSEPERTRRTTINDLY